MASPTPTHYDVAIIGGGPIGLTSSILLSLRGKSNTVFERHPDTSIHPKACGINQRTTEIFRTMGIEDEVYAHAAPPEIASRTAWYTSLGPSGREIVSRDAWGGGVYEDEYKKHSPSRYCILPQIRLEPILKRRAIELNPGGIHYNSEVTGIEQDNTGVTLTVRRNGTPENETQKIRARYAIISDGGRTFTNHLSIPWHGHPNIFDMVTVHFESPLRNLHPDPRNFMTWFSNPELGGSTKTGYLYQVGPWPQPPNPSNNEWVFACARTENDPERFDHQAMVKRLRRTLTIPDLPIDILSFSHWTVNAIYAERYRLNRAFLVGDAAHRIPPWGALGMNTGIQDAQNLIWKLQFALQDERKYDALLDTYEVERLPIGKRVGETSLHNMLSHANVMDVAAGLDGEKSVEWNKSSIESAFDKGHPGYRAKRDAIDRAQRVLDTEFKAPGYEVGWFYDCVDVNREGGETHEGQLLEDGSLNYGVYVKSTIPGHHVPHAWLKRGGERCAVFDLLVLDRLLLIAGRRGWEELGDERVKYEVIGEGEWEDVEGEWARCCGVGRDGAVLVRPDGIVAWRGERKDLTPESWRALIDKVLCCEDVDRHS